MKYSLVALAATSLLGGVSARGHLHNRRHNHHALHDNSNETCVPKCTTYVTSYLVDYTPPAPSSPAAHTYTVVPVEEVSTSTQHVTETVHSTYTTEITMTNEPKPTPEVTTCPTPGTYTIPEKTITLTQTETVCVPTTTKLSPGEHTYGGVTTIVETQTTFVCPVPTVETTGDVTTTKIIQTTYVCPTPGTYTINPITTTLTETQDCEYPVITEYPPGTYTQPEVTTTITRTSQVITCPLYTSTASVEPLPEQTSVPEPPADEEPPVEEPVEEVPVEEEPVEEEPVEEEPVEEEPVPEKPVEEEPVEEEPEEETPVEQPEEEQPEEEEPEEDTPPVNIPKEGLWAITYSPYNDDGTCKGGSDVDADVKDIASKGFSALRLYSSECNGLETVGSACAKYGLKIILGVFIKAGGVHTADSQVQDIIAWSKWELVQMFVVGNEALFQGFCSASELAAYIVEVSHKIKEAGYNGPVTTTEPLNIYERDYEVLCPVMDVVGINIHPYFNPTVKPENAGTFLSDQLKIAEELCGGKTGYVLEAGWPNSGNPNGEAIPGPTQQKIAVEAIEKAEPGRICIFTYRNDYWKNPGPLNVEQNFGCAQLF